jgi:hypothetical protein
MSTRRDTTLGEYSSGGYPGFEQLKKGTEPASETVVEAITEDLDRFQTAVQINDNTESFLVGGVEQPRSAPNYSRLYHHPKGANSGLGGVLRWTRRVTERGVPDEYTVGFSPTEENTITEVQSLTVTDHDRSERLAGLLPAIRSELTGLDWTGDTDPRPSVDDWHTAAKRLSDFATSHESPYSFPPADINRNKPTFVLARWSSPAVDSLVHVEDALLDGEDGVEKVTPEAFRELLFDYAEANGIDPA